MKSPMKLLYLISEYPKVSHSFVRREIEALVADGHAVDRLAIRGWDLPLADPADVAERARTTYVLQQGWGRLMAATLRSALQNPRAFKQAASLAWRMAKKADRSLPYHLMYLMEACWIAGHIKGAGYEHLHAHFGTNPAEVATLVGALTGLPFSFTAHGPDEFDRPEALHLREKVAQAAFVVTVSNFGRSQMWRWVNHADWAKVKVVHCGLDATFLAAPASLAPAVPRLVCVGRLSGQKGQLLLMEAAGQLKRQGVPFELVLAGDGEMRPDIERAVAQWGLADCVRITGWLSAAQVRDELLAARALVLPSFAEGLPVVVMEAMAQGRPVLSTYIAGMPELVQPGRTGWLVPAGDVDALVEAMKTCLATPAEVLTQMGQAARERAAARHDVRTEARKLAGHIQANLDARFDASRGSQRAALAMLAHDVAANDAPAKAAGSR
jgi:colanic acid/amylovoran biosynthesis glycosyltransferase